MAFPTTPTNGQQYTSNGIIYQYSSAKTAWQALTPASTAQFDEYIRLQSLSNSIVFGL
jgi:hypothetical protein